MRTHSEILSDKPDDPEGGVLVQFEVAIAHIVRNLIRIPDLSSDFF